MVDTLSRTRAPREPKYWALKQHLLDLLESLPPGAAIPTERSLATEFGVSRTTVRQALADLTAEGRLHRVQGKGTFAAEPKIAQRLQLSSYTEDIRAQGREPSSRLLEIDEIPAEGDLPKLLRIRTGAKVLRVQRVRLADGEAMALVPTTVPSARFRGLRKHIETGVSLFEALQGRYCVELEGAKDTIAASLSGPQESELLDVDVGMPVLLLELQTCA